MSTRRAASRYLFSCVAAASAFLVATACGGGFTQGPGRQTFEPSEESLAYVRAVPYPRLVVEVDYVPGAEPFDANRASIAQRLASLLDKPAGVTATLDGTIASRGVNHVWTFDEVRDLAAQTWSLPVAGDTVKMHAMFLDGSYHSEHGGTVLGVAFDQRHMAIFSDEIERLCVARGLGPLLEGQLCRDAELAVWIHEIGHVLGLVDNGLVMQSEHEDDAHPGHDHDPDCVMYWAYEGDAVIERVEDTLLGGGNGALDFDAACRDDIVAIR